MAAERVPEPWSRPSDEVVAGWGTTAADGLSDGEVQARLVEWGPNQLAAATRASWLSILVRQFKSAVVLLLVAASTLSFAVGDLLEGAAIAAAVLLSVILSFITELQAVRSMEALQRLGAVRARVRRASNDQMIAATDIVPGDILLFEGGDRITADVRIVEASKLQADESALTGESIPVGKHARELPAETPLADRKNMLYKGATVTRGSGAGVVTGTGMSTELGRIAALVEETEDEVTPLEKRLAALGRKLLWVCLAIAAVVSISGIITGRATMLMIETGIALAVASIPEGLPVVATIALARGLWRLAQKSALVKRLSAVETLGATSIIVADKTGTLTENRLSVVRLLLEENDLAVTDQEITANGTPVAPGEPGSLERALEIAALCNNASLAGDTSGDPLEVALLRTADLAGIRRPDLVARSPELREVAFDTDTKMMATIHGGSERNRVAVKGAPEAVLAVSSGAMANGQVQPLTEEARQKWLARSEQLAVDGLRILALAEKTVDDAEAEPYEGLTWIGLVGLADPPREDVVEPLNRCRRAGIRVIMATGDQPATALSIARSVGLGEGEMQVTTGTELAAGGKEGGKTEEELRRTDVFARVTPEQKLDIIQLHQESGAVVAMTGDGVNDAPALHKADIGVAMGLRGTDVAREASDMVLKDDSFASIVLAIAQGRTIFENIRRFVIYLLSCNIAEIMIVTAAVLANAPLPLLPLQILFLNLVTDVFPALALGFGEGDPATMNEPPRDPGEAILMPVHWREIGGYATLLTIAVLAAMATAFAFGATDAEATSVSFLTLGFGQLWHVFNMRAHGSHLIRNDVVTNQWVWMALALCTVLLALAVYLPPLATVLQVSRLTGSHWTIVLVWSLMPLVVGQLLLLRPARVRRR